LCLAMTQILLSFMRWKLVVLSKGVNLSLRNDFKTFYFSVFSGQWLIAGVGSDVIKTFQLKNNKKKLSLRNIFLLLIVDRFYAIAGLILIGILVGIFCSPLFISSYNLISIIIIILGLFVSMAILVNKSNKISNTLAFVFNSRRLFFKALVLSSLNIAVGASIFVLIFQTSAGLMDWRLVYGLGWFALVASVVPLTPGGLGIRELSLIFVGEVLNFDAEAIVVSSLVFGFIFMLISIPAIFFVDAKGFADLSWFERLLSERRVEGE